MLLNCSKNYWCGKYIKVYKANHFKYKTFLLYLQLVTTLTEKECKAKGKMCMKSKAGSKRDLIFRLRHPCFQNCNRKLLTVTGEGKGSDSDLMTAASSP